MDKVLQFLFVVVILTLCSDLNWKSVKQTNMQGRRLFYGAFVDWNNSGVSDNSILHPTGSTGQDSGYDARRLAESFLSHPQIRA